MTKNTDESFLTVRQVADQLNVSDRSVRRWIQRGLLRVNRFGRAVRVSRKALQAFINQSN